MDGEDELFPIRNTPLPGRAKRVSRAHDSMGSEISREEQREIQDRLRDYSRAKRTGVEARV